MKYFIIIICLGMIVLARAQTNDKVLYVSEINNYSLLIEPTTKVHKQDFGDNNSETFVFTQNNMFKFIITISSSNVNNLNSDSLSTANYEQTYQDNCGCEVLSVEQSKVGSINSMQFKIKRVEKGKVLLGFTDSFVINKTLFNLVFMTLENNLTTYKKEYFRIKDSLTFHQ